MLLPWESLFFSTFKTCKKWRYFHLFLLSFFPHTTETHSKQFVSFTIKRYNNSKGFLGSTMMNFWAVFLYFLKCAYFAQNRDSNDSRMNTYQVNDFIKNTKFTMYKLAELNRVSFEKVWNYSLLPQTQL